MSTKEQALKQIQEYGRGIAWELEYEDGWKAVSDELREQLRWVTMWEKVLVHESGLAIFITYPRNTGDGESADSYPVEWSEAEEAEVVTKVWSGRKDGLSGSFS